MSFLTSLFGDETKKYIRSLEPRVARINARESEFEAKSNDQLMEVTAELRARFQAGETLDQLLEEAFAAVREAAKRTIKQRHFDVQLMGGMTLHEGKIAEMRTGEGKTLVATLPAT
jgi:preprotein translocase subunit SecA